MLVSRPELSDQNAPMCCKRPQPSLVRQLPQAESSTVGGLPLHSPSTDGVWKLSRDVPMDNVGPLDAAPITGRLEWSLERALSRPGQIEQAARLLVDAQFPRTVAPDVLIAVGLDPTRYSPSDRQLGPSSVRLRRLETRGMPDPTSRGAHGIGCYLAADHLARR